MSKLIVANWKMQLNLKQSLQLAEAYQHAFKKSDNQIVVCPSEFALADVRGRLKGSVVKLGAQNVFWQNNGAYTGEVSAKTLAEIGCKYVIIGHSERREYLQESCHLVNLKIKSALAVKLIPIVCVGESRDKRQTKKYKLFVKGQLQRALEGVGGKKSLVIAYEPLWAIGTGKAISMTDAGEMHDYIRQVVDKLLGKSNKVKILYGGSVNEKNAGELLAIKNIDGLLIGGASLKIGSMKKIANVK